MKLCPHAGPTHGEKPCSLCWPMLRYPQPLSPNDARSAMRDLAWNPKWRGFALSLAVQMREHWDRVLRGAHVDRDALFIASMRCDWWQGVSEALSIVVGNDDVARRRAARRRQRAAA